MKKKFPFVLPLIALIAAAQGMILRLWQWSFLDAESRLFQQNAPATVALTALLCLLACSILGLVCWYAHVQKRAGAQEPRLAFRSTPAVSAMAAGGILMLCTGALHLLKFTRRLALYRSGADRLPLMELFCGLLALCAGVGLLLLARGFRSEKLPGKWQALCTLPAYTVLPWLVGLYQDYSRQPEIWLFGLNILGGVCAALGLYYAAAFAFGRNWRKRCLFFSLMGAALLLICLADRPEWADVSMICACAVLLLGQSCALLQLAPALRSDEQ